MKTRYFTKIEDKYYFNISLIFWHICVGIGALIMLAGLIVFLWSVSPTIKKKIADATYPEKPQYPEEANVSIEELIKVVFLEEDEEQYDEEILEEKQPETKPPIEIEDTSVIVQAPDKSEQRYLASLDSLKKLIPSRTNIGFWESGYYAYPFGKAQYEDSKDEQYRKWVSYGDGFEKNLEQAYRRIGATSFTGKKIVLDGYINLMGRTPEGIRADLLAKVILYRFESPSKTASYFISVSNVTKHIPAEEIIATCETLFSFGKRNDINGIPFINYLGTSLIKYQAGVREDIINVLIRNFYNFFNKDLAAQVAVTKPFLEMVGQIKAESQVKALQHYYLLYQENNRKRDEQIAKIDAEYRKVIAEIDQTHNAKESAIENRYHNKEFQKEFLQLKSLMGIGLGIAIIIVISNILVVFSIQRSVKQIADNVSK